MKTIILDTNFLIYCAKYKIDFFTEIDRICLFPYKIKILDTTIKELEKVKPKELGLIKKLIIRIEIIKAQESYVDTELIRLSKEGYIIATEDNLLKKQLKDGIITVRQMKYLELK
ncbi:hypothetical protein J4476_01430 [Candidatus Woesearchaeota archaeon]|nr:MAG: hypothetical protein QT09_C0012G0076 [archaeon GW2011_AR18]MBS3161339.1 hypothetical protein [Candidatus Woesearchaeota archaeon]HIH25370.1 hypothetical protein [Nanoarchaeota archaeon]